jgi:ParB family chromosome partitioning protein
MRQVVERDLSVRQTEALVKALKRPPPPKRPGPSANVRDLQERLARALKTRVRLVSSRKDRGRIEISYSSLDELDRLLEVLLK